MFEELREMNDEIRKKQERIEELRALAVSMTVQSAGDKIQTSGAKDRLGEIVSKIIDLEKEVDGMIDNYADKKMETKEIIFSVENEEWEDILYSHYIDFKSLQTIANEKGVNLNVIRQRNKRALKKVKSIIDDTRNL